MNNEWKTFITSQGAHIENDQVTHFAQHEAYIDGHADNILVDLSSYGLIKATGEERLSFLHNQLTNDLKALDIDHSHLSAYCSPKGRMLALFRIFQRDNAYYLSLPADTLPATLKRLRMFIMRSQVTLDDASDELVHIGFAGPGSEMILNSELGLAPMSPDDVIHQDGLTVIRLAGEPARFEIFGEAATVSQLWQNLANNATPTHINNWRALQIDAGQPIITAANVEAFVPQMANLDAVNGLSFKKGCYPGQEIVARMHYLGKLKRRLYIGHAASEHCPAAGDKLIAEDERAVGTIVDAVNTDANSIKFSAVIEIAASVTPIYINSPNKPQVTLAPLPYVIETKEN